MVWVVGRTDFWKHISQTLLNILTIEYLAVFMLLFLKLLVHVSGWWTS